MEEEIEGQRQAAMESFRSSTSSSPFVSFRSEESFDFGYYPPVSEYEEIPSLRWLSASFRSKSTPSPTPGEGHGDVIQTRPRGGRSVFGVPRGNRAASMEVAQEQELREVDLFHADVADRLRCLLSDEGEGKQERRGQQHQPLISLCFLRGLLEAFVCIVEEFKALLLVLLDRDPGLVRPAPVGRLVAKVLAHTVRSLDVCSAVDRALDSLHFCKTYAEIAVSVLRTPPVTMPQLYRARRALSNLHALLLPGDYRHYGAKKKRARLFGRRSSGGGTSNGDGDSEDPAAPRYGRRSLSLCVSQNWSAATQVEATGARFAPPHGTGPLDMAVYTMNAVIAFVVRTLVVAFPCQDQGRHGPSAVAIAAASSQAPPWQVPWAEPMAVLQEWIAEECRRERKVPSTAPSSGLLAELQSLVRCGRVVIELGGGDPQFPLDEQHREDMMDAGGELAATCQTMEEQLGPLQRQVREVIRRVLLSRAEMLGCLSRDEQKLLLPSVLEKLESEIRAAQSRQAMIGQKTLCQSNAPQESILFN